MSNTVGISDFFGSYPDIKDPLFNTLIAKKQEFGDLQPGINEPPPKRGEGYKHQKFVVRYLTWYDRLLLIHEPGTGKSCIITQSAELFKNEYLKNPDDPTKIRRAYILVRGPTLADNIKTEIVCKCTDRIYETELVMKAKSEAVMKSHITRELDTWYEIITYRSFAEIVSRYEKDEDLEKFMSNIAIYVDEAHNIPTIQDIRETKIIEEDDIGSYYDIIFRAFHLGKRNKIVLATATPANNSPIDIVPLINLILPMDQQMRSWGINEEAEFASQPLSYFEPYFRGRVSYIRALDTGAKFTPVGIQLPGRNTVVYPCFMSKFQYDVYLNSKAGNKRETFFDKQRQASSFVFPDGQFGNKGFNKYVESVGDKYKIRNNEDGRTLKSYIAGREVLYPRVGEPFINPANDEEYLDLDGNPIIYQPGQMMTDLITGEPTDDVMQTGLTGQRVMKNNKPVMSNYGLELLSAKYAQILSLCKDKYPDTDIVVDNTKGIVFVFFADYIKGSGAYMLGLCLKENGYEEFRESKSIFLGDTVQASGPCTSASQARVERRTRIPKKPRFTILTSATNKAHIPIIFSTLNSYENRYGQYIQVLIGSKTAREGININNATCMIMASSGWNGSSNWQARERVARSTSHVVRIEEEVKRRQQAGLPTNNVTIPVEIYNLVAIYQGDPDSEEKIFREDNSETIDPKMYITAEKKEQLIGTIMRFAKQSSIDCYINYNRNVRFGDVDYSSTCDYLPCNYECAGIRYDMLNKLDRTTKILYYSEEEILHAITALKVLFSKFHSLTLEQVHEQIPLIDNIFIDMAIERMVTDNIRVLHRMGYPRYLREAHSGIIYLEKNPFEINAKPENTVYSSVLIGTQDPNNNTFSDYIVSINTLKEKPLINRLLSANDPELLKNPNKLTLLSRVQLLEDALLIRRNLGHTNEALNALFSNFLHVIYEIQEPIDALAKANNKLASMSKMRNKNISRINVGLDTTLPPFDPNIIGGPVILHTLMNQNSYNKSSYGATTRYYKSGAQIRILKDGEPGFRNVNEAEYLVYNTAIQKTITQIRTSYEDKYEIYGVALPPTNKLHIRDKTLIPQAVKRNKLINDGKVCTTWLKSDLIDLLYRLEVPRPEDKAQPVNMNITRDQMVKYVLSKNKNVPVEDDKLIHFYQWYSSDFTRDDICVILRDFLKRTGRLFTGKLPSQSSEQSVGSIQVGPPLKED